MDVIEVLKIIVPAVVSIAVAWIGGRAAGKSAGQSAGQKEQASLDARVKALEDNEPADLRAARETADKALAEAKGASDGLARHVAEEQRRRDAAREVGQKRDEKLADRVEKLAEKVTTLAAQTELLLDGRVDTGGTSRRGR
jgi:hypothetical protein